LDYLLGIDVGTTSVKAILVSLAGDPLFTAAEEYPLAIPRPGWAEQDPEQWWSATCQVIKKLLLESRVPPDAVKGVGLSGQMHSSVVLDSAHQVIRPAILWCDTRTTDECREIEKRAGGLPGLLDLTGNPALEGFTAPKILWLRAHEPATIKKTKHLLLPKDYIRYRLTGRLCMDYSDAAGTLLLDVKNKKWSRKLLDLLDIDPDILPDLVESAETAGRVTGPAAAVTGLAPGTPVAGGGADNACGAVGCGAIRPGIVMVSLGSSGIVLATSQTPTPDFQGRIHLFNHAVQNYWYLMGVMLAAGLSFGWLKDKLLAGALDYDQLDSMAADVSPGSDGLLFLPYLRGERTPHADADARGVFFGISDKHTRSHFIRSVMEGVTFGLKDSMALIQALDVEIKEIRAIGGGAKSPVWQQILADTFEAEVKLLRIEEGPALGAALIAGVAVGCYRDFPQAADAVVKVAQGAVPREKHLAGYRELYDVYRSLYPSLKEEYRRLAEFTSKKFVTLST